MNENRRKNTIVNESENKNKRKTSKKNIKKKESNVAISVCLIFLIVAIAFAGAMCLKLGLEKQIVDEGEVVTYSYNINRDLGYRVNLYSNSFIEETSLEENKTYISDLVKNIEAKYSYNLNGSKKNDFKYTYSVVARLTGKYQASSESQISDVWEKDYIVVEEKTQEVKNSTSINFNETVDIDYNYYNNEVSEFRKKLKLAITANLDAVLKIKSYVKLENSQDYQLADESEIKMSIPLNKQAFDIKTTYEKNNSKNVIKDYVENYRYNFIIFAIIIFILDIIIFVTQFARIFGIEEKTKYETTVDKILKTYGDVVIEIVKPVNANVTTVIDVKNFDELINLEAELRSPILFHDIPKASEGWFTLIHENTLYRYILKDDTNNANRRKRENNK